MSKCRLLDVRDAFVVAVFSLSPSVLSSSVLGSEEPHWQGRFVAGRQFFYVRVVARVRGAWSRALWAVTRALGGSERVRHPAAVRPAAARPAAARVLRRQRLVSVGGSKAAPLALVLQQSDALVVGGGREERVGHVRQDALPRCRRMTVFLRAVHVGPAVPVDGRPVGRPVARPGRRVAESVRDDAVGRPNAGGGRRSGGHVAVREGPARLAAARRDHPEPVGEANARRDVAVGVPRRTGRCGRQRAVHEDRLRVAGCDGTAIVADVSFDVGGAADGDGARHAAVRLVEQVVDAEQLVHVVVQAGGAVLDQNAQRPRQQQRRAAPEAELRHVPGQAGGVGEGDDVRRPEARLAQLHALARLHVVVAARVAAEEGGALQVVLVRGARAHEREALREAHLGGGEAVEAGHRLAEIARAARRVVEGDARAVRVDALVVHARRRERVAVAVARYVPRASHVVVADGAPPHVRRRLAHRTHAGVHDARVHLALQLDARVRAPALGQVAEVDDDEQRDGDVDVVLGARAQRRPLGAAWREAGAVSRVGDRRRAAATPDDGADTRVGEQREHETLPVRVSA